MKCIKLQNKTTDLICLAFDAKIHDVISADGAVVDDNVPGPEGDCVPLLHFEPLLTSLVDDGGGRASGRSGGCFIIDLHCDVMRCLS